MKKILAIVFIVFLLNLNAQPPGGPPGGGTTTGAPPCWEPDCIPIDGGLGFLIASGITLGFYKMKKRRNKNNQ